MSNLVRHTLLIRASSSLSVGLWSMVIATAVPSLEHTHLESPAFATTRVSPLISATTWTMPLAFNRKHLQAQHKCCAKDSAFLSSGGKAPCFNGNLRTKIKHCLHADAAIWKYQAWWVVDMRRLRADLLLCIPPAAHCNPSWVPQTLSLWTSISLFQSPLPRLHCLQPSQHSCNPLTTIEWSCGTLFTPAISGACKLTPAQACVTCTGHGCTSQSMWDGHPFSRHPGWRRRTLNHVVLAGLVGRAFAFLLLVAVILGNQISLCQLRVWILLCKVRLHSHTIRRMQRH